MFVSEKAGVFGKYSEPPETVRLKLTFMAAGKATTTLVLTEPMYLNRQRTYSYLNSYSANQTDIFLTIHKSSRFYGRAEGGDDITLLTSSLDPADIDVKLLQFNDCAKVLWGSSVHIDKIEVHKNCCLILIKTPKHIHEISKRTKVFFQLNQPSTKKCGNRVPFFYCPPALYEEYVALFGLGTAIDTKYMLTRKRPVGEQYEVSAPKRSKGFKKDMLERSYNNEGGSLSVQDEEGNTIIHLCVIRGDLDLLALVVNEAAENVVNMTNCCQMTALLTAAHLEKSKMCALLLAKSDMHATDVFGNNVLHVACSKKNLSLLQVLHTLFTFINTLFTFIKKILTV